MMTRYQEVISFLNALRILWGTESNEPLLGPLLQSWAKTCSKLHQDFVSKPILSYEGINDQRQLMHHDLKELGRDLKQ